MFEKKNAFSCNSVFNCGLMLLLLTYLPKHKLLRNAISVFKEQHWNRSPTCRSSVEKFRFILYIVTTFYFSIWYFCFSRNSHLIQETEKWRWAQPGWCGCGGGRRGMSSPSWTQSTASGRPRPIWTGWWSVGTAASPSPGSSWPRTPLISRRCSSPARTRMCRK